MALGESTRVLVAKRLHCAQEDSFFAIVILSRGFQMSDSGEAVTGSASKSTAHGPALLKTLSWRDGFVLALANPGFLIGSLGYSIGALGGWGAMVLWGISMVIGAAAARIYAEMASMFPDKPGGLALYAYEAWRKYFSWVGPIATFGYWFAWSTVLSIFGIVVGTLISTEWFPKVTFQVNIGVRHVGLPVFIAAGVVVLVWLFNIFGIKPAVWVSYVIGIGLMVPLAVFIVGPYVSGHFHFSNLHWGIGGKVSPSPPPWCGFTSWAGRPTARRR